MYDTTLLGRPVHFSIVDYIKAVGSPSEMVKAADHIIGTALPANHDNIKIAWCELLEAFHLDDSQFHVLPALASKKAAAEEKARAQLIAKLSERIGKRFRSLTPKLSRKLYVLDLLTFPLPQLVGAVGKRKALNAQKKLQAMGLQLRQEIPSDILSELQAKGIGRQRQLFDAGFTDPARS